MVLPTLKTIQQSFKNIHFKKTTDKHEEVLNTSKTETKKEDFILMKGWLNTTVEGNNSKSKNSSSSPKRNFFQLFANSNKLIYFEVIPGIPEKIIPLENSVIHNDLQCKNSFWICAQDNKRYLLEDISEENKDRWISFLGNVDGVTLKFGDSCDDECEQPSSIIEPLFCKTRGIPFSLTRNEDNKIISINGIGFQVVGEHIGTDNTHISTVSTGIHKFDIICSQYVEAQKFNVNIYLEKEDKSLILVEEGNVTNVYREGYPVVAVEYSIEKEGYYTMEIKLNFGIENDDLQNLHSIEKHSCLLPSGKFQFYGINQTKPSISPLSSLFHKSKLQTSNQKDPISCVSPS